MKKLTALLLSLTLALVACGGSPDTTEPDTSPATAQSPTPATPASPTVGTTAPTPSEFTAVNVIDARRKPPTPIVAVLTADHCAPATGALSGGYDVTVVGTALDTVDQVLGIPTAADLLSFVHVDATHLTVTIPTGLATGPVNILLSSSSLADTVSVPFTFTADCNALTLTSIAPLTIPKEGGTLLTLHGSGFACATAHVDVQVFLSHVAFTVVDDSTITFLAPSMTVGGPFENPVFPLIADVRVERFNSVPVQLNVTYE